MVRGAESSSKSIMEGNSSCLCPSEVGLWGVTITGAAEDLAEVGKDSRGLVILTTDNWLQVNIISSSENLLRESGKSSPSCPPCLCALCLVSHERNETSSNNRRHSAPSAFVPPHLPPSLHPSPSLRHPEGVSFWRPAFHPCHLQYGSKNVLL